MLNNFNFILESSIDGKNIIIENDNKSSNATIAERTAILDTYQELKDISLKNAAPKLKIKKLKKEAEDSKIQSKNSELHLKKNLLSRKIIRPIVVESEGKNLKLSTFTKKPIKDFLVWQHTNSFIEKLVDIRFNSNIKDIKKVCDLIDNFLFELNTKQLPTSKNLKISSEVAKKFNNTFLITKKGIHLQEKKVLKDKYCIKFNNDTDFILYKDKNSSKNKKKSKLTLIKDSKSKSLKEKNNNKKIKITNKKNNTKKIRTNKKNTMEIIDKNIIF